MRTMHCIVIVALAIAAGAAGAQDNPRFDPSLAQSTGADERGMRSYVLVILKTGPKKIEDKAERDKIFQGHFANMGRLASEKKLVFAGPLDGKEGRRGIFVIATPDIEEAKRLLERFVTKYQSKAPKLAAWAAEAIPEGFAVFALPASHRRRLRTTNALERVNKEIKRRTRVATLFPNEQSCERLITAIVMEISEEWVTGKIYLNMETDVALCSARTADRAPAHSAPRPARHSTGTCGLTPSIVGRPTQRSDPVRRPKAR